MAKAISISGTMAGSLPGRLQMSREVGYLNNTGYTIGVLTFDGHIDVVPSGTGKIDDHGKFIITITTKAQRELLLSGLKDDMVSWKTKKHYREMLEIHTSRSGSDSHIKTFAIETEDILGTEGVYIEELDIVIFNARQSVHPEHPRVASMSSNGSLVSSSALSLQIESVTDDDSQAISYINLGGATYEIFDTSTNSRLKGCYVASQTPRDSTITRYDGIAEYTNIYKSMESAKEFNDNLPAKVIQLEKEVVELTKKVMTLNADYIKANTELQTLKRNDFFGKEFIGGAITTKDRNDDSAKKLLETNSKISEMEVKSVTDGVSNNKKLAGDLLKFTTYIPEILLKAK